MKGIAWQVSSGQVPSFPFCTRLVHGRVHEQKRVNAPYCNDKTNSYQVGGIFYFRSLCFAVLATLAPLEIDACRGLGLLSCQGAAAVWNLFA
jgi:hypothetical protein